MTQGPQEESPELPHHRRGGGGAGPPACSSGEFPAQVGSGHTFSLHACTWAVKASLLAVTKATATQGHGLQRCLCQGARIKACDTTRGVTEPEHSGLHSSMKSKDPGGQAVPGRLLPKVSLAAEPPGPLGGSWDLSYSCPLSPLFEVAQQLFPPIKPCLRCSCFGSFSFLFVFLNRGHPSDQTLS